jgi:predicted NUDIX family NTP pyrophosphohydrolase
MPKKSAGILLYRFRGKIPEMMIVHPGGPYWVKKDEGAWSIPKGEFGDDETPLEAATREFREETGQEVNGSFIPLTPVKQGSGKIIHAFALEHDLDTSIIKSNSFTMEWPPKSGKQKDFPEIDRGEWCTADLCRRKIIKGQLPFIEELLKILNVEW